MLNLRYFFKNDVDVTSMTFFDVLKSIRVSESILVRTYTQPTQRLESGYIG